MNKILEDAVTVYSHLLRFDFKAQEFLKNRGIKGRTAAYFKLGASRNTGEFYNRMSTEFKYTDEQLEKSGLMRFNGEPMEVFNNAVTLPLFDVMGNVINITSRKYDDNPCKYINLPKTPIVDFFGVEVLQHRYNYGVGSDLLMLAEGQFDTIILQQMGYPAMGILGVTNIRQAMFKHLQFFSIVVLCFDNDAPGKKATHQMASYIRHYYPSMRIFQVDLGEHNDVNDYFLAGNTHKELTASFTKIEDIAPSPLKRFRKKKGNRSQPNPLIQELKKIDIKEFLQTIIKEIKFDKRDTLYKTTCPFKDHNDTVASFTIYTENNTYYCWGCGRGGDVLDFCSKFFNVKFREAVDILQKWRNR